MESSDCLMLLVILQGSKARDCSVGQPDSMLADDSKYWVTNTLNQRNLATLQSRALK